MNNYDKFYELLGLLPGFVTDFFVKENDRYQIRTKLAYANDMKLFFEWVIESGLTDASVLKEITIEDMSRITDDDLDMYMVYLDHYLSRGEAAFGTVRENGASSKRRKLSSLRVLFRYLLKKKKILTDPTELVETPKLRKDKAVIHLSGEQGRAVMDAALNGKVGVRPGQSERGLKRQETLRQKTRYRDLAIIAVFLGTGVRISELVNMDLYDVDIDENSILVIRKGGSRDLVYYNEEVKDALLEYMLTERNELLHISEEVSESSIPENGPLFVSRGGKRITVRRVQQLVNDYASYALPSGMKISPHVLRKTFGTKVYRDFHDLSLAQAALGHKSVSTTEMYYVAFDKERLKVLKDNSIDE